MSAQIEFNAQMYVSEQLTRQLVNTTQDVTIRCVQVLAEKFNFDADEAIQMLGLSMIKLERKMPEKAKVAKAVKVVAPKSAFPLPYNGEFNDACCYALRQNNGLYTQCTGNRKGEASYCKVCANQMQKVGADIPEYGTIQQRMAVGIFEYVDPKGRKPIAYAKIMKKLKLDETQVLTEAGKNNITINPEHFVLPEETKRGRPKAEKAPKEKGPKGRPKKSKKVLHIEGDDEDLFAALVAEANESEDSEESEETVMPGKKKAGKSDEEKEAERLAKEQEKKEKEAKRLAEKAEKEAKLAAEKAEKEAKKKAEEEARAAKKAAEEAEKQAKKEAAELAKKEKEAKLAAEKAAKEAKKSEKSEKSNKKAKAEAEPVEDDEEPDVVKKIEFQGKKYLKSKKTGIVYDYNMYVKESQQVVIGKWCETTNKIVFNNDEEEEEEEEYDD
jgi:chemotaxis protein histidine kinase CheA